MPSDPREPPPPILCPKCRSHRTRPLGRSESYAPPLVYVRCEQCGHTFTTPADGQDGPFPET